MAITLKVNGRACRLHVDPDTRLLYRKSPRKPTLYKL